jgi:hypothetical protein
LAIFLLEVVFDQQRSDLAIQFHGLCPLAQLASALFLLLLLFLQQLLLEKFELPVLVEVEELNFLFLGSSVVFINNLLVFVESSKRTLVLIFQFFDLLLVEFKFHSRVDLRIE